MNRAYKEKALDGFPSKTREAVPEVSDPTSELAAPPPHLDKNGVKLWHDLSALMAEMRVLTAADWLSLTVLCDAYSTYLKATEVLAEEGMVIEVGNNGYQQQHPFVSIRNNALDVILRISKEYGMSAMSRRRLQAPTTSSAETPDTLLDW
jgi:P27 family predicted phage terminase small subunit